MKTKSIIITFFAAALAMSSCKKVDVVPEHPGTPTPASPPPGYVDVSAFITSGSWKILEFRKDGQDLTRQYDRWHFRFSPAGVLTASTFHQIQRGKWDSRIFHDPALIINLDAPAGYDLLKALSNDWAVAAAGDGLVRLKALTDSGGSQVLVFRKFQEPPH